MAAGHDDHVTDVAGVAQGPVQQPPVEDDATADAGAHDHGDEVAVAGGGAQPALAQGQRLGIVVDVDGKVQGFGQAGPEREPVPLGNVQR